MMKNVLSVWLVVSLCIGGCHMMTGETEGAGDTQGGRAVAFDDAHFRPLGDFDVLGSSRFKGDSPRAVEARLALLDSVMEYVDRIRLVIQSGDHWRIISEQILSIMSAPELTEAQSWFVDQLGASMVLERLALETKHGPPSISVQDAAGRFAEVLIYRKSPNAPLLADGLSLTRGYWTGDRIRRAALLAANHAGEYLEACPACGDASKRNAQGVSDREFRIVARGQSRLIRLAEESQ